MPRREILEYPDPRLHEPSASVTVFDADLETLIDDLHETLAGTDTLALSAPQVDDHRAVLVLNAPTDKSIPVAYVNPEILSKRGLGFVQESCLSLPGVVGNVLRAMEINVRAQDRNGDPFEVTLSAMDAVCLQHEIDHLEGTLFVDRLTWLGRLRFRAFSGRRARRRNQLA